MIVTEAPGCIVTYGGDVTPLQPSRDSVTTYAYSSQENLNIKFRWISHGYPYEHCALLLCNALAIRRCVVTTHNAHTVTTGIAYSINIYSVRTALSVNASLYSLGSRVQRRHWSNFSVIEKGWRVLGKQYYYDGGLTPVTFPTRMLNPPVYFDDRYRHRQALWSSRDGWSTVIVAPIILSRRVKHSILRCFYIL